MTNHVHPLVTTQAEGAVGGCDAITRATLRPLLQLVYRRRAARCGKDASKRAGRIRNLPVRLRIEGVEEEAANYRAEIVLWSRFLFIGDSYRSNHNKILDTEPSFFTITTQ